MKYSIKSIIAVLLCLTCVGALGQGNPIIRGEVSPGVYANVAVDATGKMYQYGVGGVANTLSTVNSSTAALGANGVFTGTAEDITGYAEIRVSVFSNVASATDGLQVQQSKDGVNWDGSDSYTVAANTNKTFGMGASSQYFRIVYTNGAGAQATFRLTVKFAATRTKPSSVRTQDARSNENDFEEVSAYNSVYNGTTWDRARGDTTGSYVVKMASAAGGYSFTNMTTLTTTTLKSGAGFFHTLSVNTKGVTNTVACYDSLSASGTKIATIDTTVGENTFIYDLAFATGLTCITAGGTAADLTMTWK